MSHSIKKMLRRQGGVTCVKGKKNKMKMPSHPGAKGPSKPQQKAEERDKEAMEEVTGTTVRAEARRQLGKEKRLEETARRRGIDLGGSAKALGGGGDSMVDAEEEVASAALAAGAAKRALAFAPATQ